MVFGVGGVGSHVVACLARSGIGRITIVDFDRITLSSLNRHAFATRSHVGKSKVTVFIDYLKSIVPHLRLRVWDSFVTPTNLETFFKEDRIYIIYKNLGVPDMVIDCIDNLEAKAALVSYCTKNNIPVVCSCGAGMKADPTRIQIRDLKESTYDDLARALRLKLKNMKSV